MTQPFYGSKPAVQSPGSVQYNPNCQGPYLKINFALIFAWMVECCHLPHLWPHLCVGVFSARDVGTEVALASSLCWSILCQGCRHRGGTGLISVLEYSLPGMSAQRWHWPHLCVGVFSARDVGTEVALVVFVCMYVHVCCVCAIFSRQ